MYRIVLHTNLSPWRVRQRHTTYTPRGRTTFETKIQTIKDFPIKFGSFGSFDSFVLFCYRHIEDVLQI